MNFTKEDQTRNSNLGSLYVPPSRSTKYGLHSLKIRAISAWNNLAKIIFNIEGKHILSFSRNDIKTT